ncbi:MAG: response regulator, partial [Rhizobiales bacterium]|nr:response regulator [Hyphomicrobiales bacterium]
DRANRAKSRFLATASHDLRQPMQTIRLLNATLLRMVQHTDMSELLRQQGQAIESMARLLNALLDISRLESGAIEPVNREVRVADLFEELHSEFASLARARNLDLQMAAAVEVLSTDRTLFYQLLQNLVGNALKYTDSGWVRLKCSLESQGLVIAVEDSGIGIPADKLERIFDEYYQVDTHGAKRMGVGLGLAIVKELVRLLGFSVTIRSKLGEGTQVALNIPTKHRMLSASVAPGLVPVHAPVSAAHKPRLILVEDNEGVRMATELFLKVEGYQTLSAATSGRGRVLLLGILPGDIVIADYHLDGGNTGLDLIQRLRERLGHEVPGVVLSGDLPAVRRTIRRPLPLVISSASQWIRRRCWQPSPI